jgi:hypothetical protein
MNAHNRHSLKHSFAALRVDAWPSRVNLVWVLINNFFWSIIVQVMDGRATEPCSTSASWS